MNTDSYIVYLKTEDIYVDIAKYVKTRFDTSDQKDHYLKEKNRKVIRLTKIEFGGKVMIEFL